MNALRLIFLFGLMAESTVAWAPAKQQSLRQKTELSAAGSLHGQNSCFMPLKQLDQDYWAPRIVQIAGAYPGLTKEEFFAVKSEPSAPEGQWTYDFSDPDGPQLGTVALDGGSVVAACEDPVAIIAEHTSLAVPLPDAITEPVDLIVLVDRAANHFAERRFLLTEQNGELIIGAFETKADLPAGCEILGQVQLCQIPWLPSMKKTKTGFMEVDEYF
mmetsp:Transcript_45785/g.110980  ORF Transcript_45785/g.110980 Transcript_45785/m.110980 type:complete len:216 (-) Transcript_45785:56-703(-)|eukprot:CAMPEP_0113604590 /NCGR_PEP_ID=MMETSP0017_2-20120614/1874_1 /TAXON_ID=2856 /ORGANISM="Cylindrotheca closterium" /LENGTH=215 /DNA_ID=CAMNT_0000513021 /DNA_START=129 /DNA_END=776 /DNA_ORIENTATION=- /assembly_acc=CAM_ASM_000147